MFSLDQFSRFIPRICPQIQSDGTSTSADDAPADPSVAALMAVPPTTPAPVDEASVAARARTQVVRNQYYGRKLTYSRAYATCEGL